MKKLPFMLLSVMMTLNCFAQLEVDDTLLMVKENEVFWGSSSELEQGNYADLGKYGAVNLGDNDQTTCWAEGLKNDGTGASVFFTISNNIEKIKIRNGYQKKESIYYANNRPKNVEFTLYASYEPSGYVTETHTGFFISEPLVKTKATLEDILGYQDVSLGFNWPVLFSELDRDRTFDKDRFILKITILDVYKGNKWDDACISDIKVLPVPLFELTADEHGFVKKLNNSLDTLFYNSENIYQAIEVSADLQWAIFIIMPSELEGRSETTYKLYNTEQEKFIDIKDVFQMYEFEEKEGKLYLLGTDKDFNDFAICLDDI